MTLLTNFDPYQDFFSSNPQLKVLFSKHLSTPSSHMWALFLFAHPDSKFFNESPEDRKSLIYKDYLKEDPTFDWDEYSPLIEVLNTYVLTKAQRALMRWEQALHERDDFMASIPYTVDTFELKDKMMAATPKLWDQYESILERLTKEQSSTHGDQEESLSEKQLI
jgi:hypothetical protein